MDKITSNKIEKLLQNIGYYDLEFQHLTKTKVGTTIYAYIGYTDAPIFIMIFIRDIEVEVMDCYATENNYVQSKKLSIEEFLNNY